MLAGVNARLLARPTLWSLRDMIIRTVTPKLVLMNADSGHPLFLFFGQSPLKFYLNLGVSAAGPPILVGETLPLGNFDLANYTVDRVH
jgi:hypothetical protein